MAREVKTIDCTNYFNEIGKRRLSEALEAGDTVSIYINCIGHSRAYWEGKAYEEWLEERYGERLEVGKDAFSKTYRLTA